MTTPDPPSETPPTPEKIHTTLYRVNRLGQEIFSGDLTAFENTVRQRRIKADDLIFDEDTQTWGFARQHPIFLKLIGQGGEQLKRRSHKNITRQVVLRLLLSILLATGFFYIIIFYSKEIEFKRSEASFDSLSDLSDSKRNSMTSDDLAEGEGEGKGEGSGGDGEGEGGKNGKGGKDGELGEGADDPKKKKKKKKQILTSEGIELEMVFDLNAEGMKQTLDLVKGTDSLSDEALLKRAQNLSKKKGSPKERYDALQEAIAYTEFVRNRSLHERRKSHQMAELNLESLNGKLVDTCHRIQSPRFCQYKGRNPSWSDAEILSILQKKVILGMLETQAKIAWGKPRDVKRRIGGRTYCYNKKCTTAFNVNYTGRVSEVIVDEE